MKLISFERNGRASFGAVVNDRVLDLLPHFKGEASDLKELIARNLVDKAREIAKSRAPELGLDEVTLLPVIPNPGKIVCIGLNYRDHIEEAGREVTAKPVLFLRVADSQVGHSGDIVRPTVSERLDYEGEIAVVIGKEGRHVSEADAWSHIAGYSCYNDGSIRDWQGHTQQWTPGKNFWRTGGFGPWLVTSDEIAPGQVMTLVTRLNGQEVQRTTTDLMVHSIPRQIAYISTFIPLVAGDVIVTGTPGGVGMKRTPPLFMKPGDVVEIDVDAVGVLRNGVRAEEA